MSPEQERFAKFAALRKSAHEQIDRESERRMADNPAPTEEEVTIGAFREMIEPQVRDAVFQMLRKGYTTDSSGFGGENSDIQSLDGYFDINADTLKKLEELGVKVLKGKDVGLPHQTDKYTYLQIKPERADMEEIKRTWDRIVEALPARNIPAEPSLSGGSADFRRRFAPDRKDIEKRALQLNLNYEEWHPDAERQMRERLKQLGSEDEP